MKRLLVIFAFVLFVITDEAKSQVLLDDGSIATTRRMMQVCASSNHIDSIACGYYIQGMYFGFVMLQNRSVLLKTLMCVPDSVTIGQLTSVFLKHCKDHPDVLPLSSPSQFLASLEAAFPCQQSDVP